MMRKTAFILGISVTIVILTLLVGAQSAGIDFNGSNIGITPSSNPQYTDVSFNINNIGNQSSEGKWRLSLFLNGTEKWDKDGSVGVLNPGKSKSVNVQLDLKDSKLIPNTKYYLMLIVGDANGKDINIANGIFPDKELKDLYGSQIGLPSGVIPINNFKVLTPPQTIPLNIYISDSTIAYFQNSNNPNLGDYDVNLKVNTNKDITVCMKLKVRDSNGNVNYLNDGCANNVYFNLLSGQINDIDAPADSDATKDDNLYVELYDPQTKLVLNGSIDISQNIQTSGYVDVIDHYLNYNIKTNQWVFNFRLDNSYPKGYPVDIRFNILSHYIDGVTGAIGENQEYSPYMTLSQGSQNKEFKLPNFGDEIDFNATVEGLGIYVANAEWIDVYPKVTLPNISTVNVSNIRSQIVGFGVPLYEIQHSPGNLSNITLKMNEMNIINLAFLENAKFDNNTIQCLQNNVDKWFVYDLDGNIKGSMFKLINPNSKFESGTVGIVIPKGTGCLLTGEIDTELAYKTTIDETVTVNNNTVTVISTGTPRKVPIEFNISGVYSAPVQPSWEGYAPEDLNLCIGATVLDKAFVVQAGNYINLKGIPFDFSITPKYGDLLSQGIFVECR